MAEEANLDVAIAGAGPAGLAAALGFAARGFRVAVAETAPQASKKAARGRSAALLGVSVDFLRSLGLWAECAAHAAPLAELRFIDDTGRLLRAPDSVFRASEIGLEAFGYNIANADLARALRAAAEDRNVPVLETGPLAAISDDENGIRLEFERAVFRARLAIAADGRTSPLREAAGIRALSWRYDQIAIATAFSHERPHDFTCIEIHRAAGPFTLVPLPGGRSALVWVERADEAQRLAALPDDAFAQEAEAVMRGRLGRLSDVAERGTFPLSALAARDYGRRRVALVGEAAHVTPPIGAQGLNLGFRDVEAIVRLAAEARDANRDFGGEDVLSAYSAARRGDILSRTAGIDLLNRSLLSDFLPLQIGRGLGLYALGTIGPLRRAFMRSGISPARQR